MACLRINDSFLAGLERKLLGGLVRRLPAGATPDQLTAIGLAGALLTAVGFVACRWCDAGLVPVVVGLFLNWFGDSLDGTLARFRRIERQHYGFFIDHSADLIAQTLIIVGLGLSPFFTIPSALLVLSLYLLMSSYTYLRVVTESVHRLSYGGLGATEFRILVAAWALFAAACGPGLISFEICSFVGLDLIIGLLSAVTFIGFIGVVRNDLSRLRREEPLREAPRAIAPAPEVILDHGLQTAAGAIAPPGGPLLRKATAAPADRKPDRNARKAVQPPVKMSSGGCGVVIAPFDFDADFWRWEI